MIVDMEIGAKITSRGYLVQSINHYRTCQGEPTGLTRSLNHQTISEHVLGSGAMISIGSARTRHSQIDHIEVKQFANALRGVQVGREARICVLYLAG
jgi:hypothetical protein